MQQAWLAPVWYHADISSRTQLGEHQQQQQRQQQQQ
jgi:hypothetical protein